MIIYRWGDQLVHMETKKDQAKTYKQTEKEVNKLDGYKINF